MIKFYRTKTKKHSILTIQRHYSTTMSKFWINFSYLYSSVLKKNAPKKKRIMRKELPQRQREPKKSFKTNSLDFKNENSKAPNAPEINKNVIQEIFTNLKKSNAPKFKKAQEKDLIIQHQRTKTFTNPKQITENTTFSSEIDKNAQKALQISNLKVKLTSPNQSQSIFTKPNSQSTIFTSKRGNFLSPGSKMLDNFKKATPLSSLHSHHNLNSSSNPKIPKLATTTTTPNLSNSNFNANSTTNLTLNPNMNANSTTTATVTGLAQNGANISHSNANLNLNSNYNSNNNNNASCTVNVIHGHLKNVNNISHHLNSSKNKSKVKSSRNTTSYCSFQFPNNFKGNAYASAASAASASKLKQKQFWMRESGIVRKNYRTTLNSPVAAQNAKNVNLKQGFLHSSENPVVNFSTPTNLGSMTNLINFGHGSHQLSGQAPGKNLENNMTPGNLSPHKKPNAMYKTRSDHFINNNPSTTNNPGNSTATNEVNKGTTNQIEAKMFEKLNNLEDQNDFKLNMNQFQIYIQTLSELSSVDILKENRAFFQEILQGLVSIFNNLLKTQSYQSSLNYQMLEEKVQHLSESLHKARDFQRQKTDLEHKLHDLEKTTAQFQDENKTLNAKISFLTKENAFLQNQKDLAEKKLFLYEDQCMAKDSFGLQSDMYNVFERRGRKGEETELVKCLKKLSKQNNKNIRKKKKLQYDIKYLRQRENKLMYLLYILQREGYPVRDLYEQEIKNLSTSRFCSDEELPSNLSGNESGANSKSQRQRRGSQKNPNDSFCSNITYDPLVEGPAVSVQKPENVPILDLNSLKPIPSKQHNNPSQIPAAEESLDLSLKLEKKFTKQDFEREIPKQNLKGFEEISSIAQDKEQGENPTNYENNCKFVKDVCSKYKISSQKINTRALGQKTD